MINLIHVKPHRRVELQQRIAELQQIILTSGATIINMTDTFVFTINNYQTDILAVTSQSHSNIYLYLTSLANDVRPINIRESRHIRTMQ